MANNLLLICWDILNIIQKVNQYIFIYLILNIDIGKIYSNSQRILIIFYKWLFIDSTRTNIMHVVGLIVIYSGFTKSALV